MSAAAAPAPPARPRSRVARLPLAALALAAALLAAALITGPGGATAPYTAASAVLWLLLAGQVGQRAWRLARAGDWRVLATGVLSLSVLLLLALLAGRAMNPSLGWAVLASVPGLLLLIAGAAQRVAGDATTPWQRLTGREGTSRRADQLRGVLAILTGASLLLIAALMLWTGLEEFSSSHPVRAAVLRVLLVAALIAGAGLVVLHRERLRAVLVRAQPAPTADDDFAAQLHDSVLQTLAMIGRSAGDPEAVRRLARQQERELRDRLAGRDRARGGTLAAALRALAADVEASVDGAQIELVTVGDAPIDPRVEVLLRAAEEALRNACHHGAAPQHLYAEVDGDGAIELFVRDGGGGFDPAQLPPERRGVRDAIIGRMQHAGGSATIDSSSDGTEVGLRLPAPQPGEGAPQR